MVAFNLQRPAELVPNEQMGDGGNGIIFIGTKGKHDVRNLWNESAVVTNIKN